jgi:hypothetical protein
MSLIWGRTTTVESILPLVAGATARPSSLACLLAGYDPSTLGACLACDPRTALWLQLCDRPCDDRWRLDVDGLAHAFALDPARLEALLLEATLAESAANQREHLPQADSLAA